VSKDTDAKLLKIGEDLFKSGVIPKLTRYFVCKYALESLIKAYETVNSENKPAAVKEAKGMRRESEEDDEEGSENEELVAQQEQADVDEEEDEG